MNNNIYICPKCGKEKQMPQGEGSLEPGGHTCSCSKDKYLSPSSLLANIKNEENPNSK